jgi:multiple sugar transport system permease protein
VTAPTATRPRADAPPPARGGDVARAARRRADRRRRLTVLSFMSPWVVGFSVFFAYPLVTTAYLSFTHYDLLSSPRWVGLANYRFMGEDPNFWPGVRNSLWMIVIAVPVTVLFAFCVALTVSKAKRGAGLLRTVFYLPTLAPPVAATLGFVYLFNARTGPVDKILGWLHLPQPLWFDDPHFAKPALTLLGMWGVGTVMIIFLASLLDVPVQLYEAAELDGANSWQRLVHVTVPSISPVILFAVVTGVIDGLQYFTQGYVAGTVAGGGDAGAGTGSSLGYPEGSTLFYPVWLFQQGFQYFHMGYAAAMAVVLFVIALAVTAVLLRTARHWVAGVEGIGE